MNKNLEILEFHKILEMLANLSANEITREKVRTIVPCSDLAEARTELEKTNDVKAAAYLGTVIGKKAVEAGIESVVFDRGGYIYHGKVKALADAAREAGLKF